MMPPPPARRPGPGSGQLDAVLRRRPLLGPVRDVTSTGTGAGTRAAVYLQRAAGMALFGSATPVSKIAGRAFPSMLASGLRMVAAAVLLPVVLVAHRRRNGSTGRGCRVRAAARAERDRSAARRRTPP